MKTALFINGIYESVLEEIIRAQKESNADEIFYLQPNKSQKINMLEREAPTPNAPIILYISTTGNLSNLAYIADIVQWENKRNISPERDNFINDRIQKYQPGEKERFNKEKESINLISIRGLKKLTNFPSTQILIKKSDGIPLKLRTRSGGWSEVYEVKQLEIIETQTIEQHDETLTRGISESRKSSDDERKERLRRASKTPDKVQILSVGYIRNPDVVVEVLKLAKGKCEQCHIDAPFIRKSDGSPYLEVHHWIPLAKGGEDSVENAAALCPTCHRKIHFGIEAEPNRRGKV